MDIYRKTVQLKEKAPAEAHIMDEDLDRTLACSTNGARLDMKYL
jgi:hypothetical protein